MEETPLERRRRLARERKRRERARRSPSKVAAARAADALAKEEKRKRIREINAYERYMRQQNLLSLQNVRPPAIIRKDGSTSLDDDWGTQVATGTSQSFLRSDDLFPPKPQKKNPIRRSHRASAKPVKLQENHDFQLKTMVVPNHQHFVMSNLSSLWKNKMLCDAGIGNGTSTIKVHKVVLSAICPKLLSVFNTDISSQKFLQVNFPEEVTEEALNAFAEYMYDGILNLNHDILKQLKIIAKRLDMKEFMQLCDSHLPNPIHQPSAAAVSFTNFPSIQTNMSVPAMSSSTDLLGSPVSIPTECNPSITTRVIDVKQEITEADLAQVQKDTAAIFGQESAVAPLAPNKSGNSAGFVICPSIKTEPVETDDNRYGQSRSNRNSNQVFTSTTSPSTATYTSISSVPSSSSTEFSIPFSQSTDVKSTRLKTTHSYETPLVSDLSPVSHIVETMCSQSSPMSVDSSKSVKWPPTYSSCTEGSSTSTSSENIYPVGLFTSAGNSLPILTTETVDVKTIDLY